MNAEINTVWFRERIAAKQTSQRKIAKSLGLDPAAISLMLRGKRRILPHEAEKLAAELGSPLQEVLENMGVNIEAGAHNKVAIVGLVDDVGLVRMVRPSEGPRRVSAPVGVPDDAAALRHQTEGFTDGWLSFFQPTTGGVSHECVGRLCVCQAAGKAEWYLRVLRRSVTKGAWNLVDPYGRTGPVEGVRLASAAPVLWIKTTA